MHALSIVIPVWNEEKNILPLVERIHKAMHEKGIVYEIIFVDDHSTDATAKIIKKLLKDYPVTFLVKKGKKGKTFSLTEGFAQAQYGILAMIDADLQYPPEAIPAFINKMQNGADIVVANRIKSHTSQFRQFVSKSFRTLFGKLLFGLDYDVQAGLKVFRKDVYQMLGVKPTSGWAFDLEFLHRARQAGFTIANYDIIFEKRLNGESKISFVTASIGVGLNALQVKTRKNFPISLVPETPQTMRGAGMRFKKHRYITHTTLHHSKSAIKTFIAKQLFFIFGILILTLIGFFFYPLKTLQIVIGVLSFIYFTDVLFNLFLILKSLHVPQEISFSEEALAKLTPAKLPVYSILCPLYKEAHVIPQFLEAIAKLDYPKNKLDVLLLLEEDDKESIEKVKELMVPSYVRTVLVPHSLPKTKPKACNYGLSQAKGEYLVIYDAEDMPDPLQLKKAYLGFQKVSPDVLCLQAKLNYYNPHQNLLTRLFTAEYSLWFDITLTGLQSIGTSIPLGGTSNHFRTADLLHLQGWDPFNVTEDADLGIRLFKAGYKTAIIDSMTLEEANSKYGNWLRQRSRWIKGYMQTYLVHTRDNFSFFRRNTWHACIFHLSIGGKIAFILINPLLWILTITYFTFRATVGPTIESLYPPYVFYMAAASLVFGNFLFLYYYMIGCVKREQWSLVKYAYLVPLYWVMISIAGFIALYQLIFKPFYWEKTVHGLHLKKKIKHAISQETITAQEKAFGFTFPAKMKNKISSLITKRRLFVSSTILVISTVIINFLNFLFNAYLGRVLNFADFSIVTLVSVFTYIIGLPSGSVGTTVNYRTAFLEGRFGEKNAYLFWKKAQRIALIAGLLSALVWVLLTPLLAHFFQSPSLLPFITFIPALIVSFLIASDRAYLSGKFFFTSLAVATLSEAVFKLFFAFIIFHIGFENLTYFAIPLSWIGTWLVSYLLVKKIPLPQGEVMKSTGFEKFPFSFFVASFVSGIASTGFLSFDVILAKHYLSPTLAGQYALVSLIGKIIYFLSGLSSQFILPLVSKSEGNGTNAKKTLFLITVATLGLSFAGFVIFSIFAQFTLPLLFGSKAHAILPYIPAFTIGMIAFSLTQVFTTFYLIKKFYTFSVLSLLTTLLQIVFIFFMHDSVQAIVSAMVLVGFIGLGLTLLFHFFSSYIKIFENNIIDLFELFTHKKQHKEKNKLTILIFNWRDTKHTWGGGAEVYIQEIAKRWVRDGNHVTIFCGNDGLHARNEIIDGIQIIRRGGFYMVYIWAFLYYIFKFRGIYDIVIDSENGIPFFTPLYRRTPIFLLIHHIHQEVYREYLKFPFSKIAMLLEGRLMPFVYHKKTVITVSASSKREIMKLKFSKEKDVAIVHPGIIDCFKKSKKTLHPTLVYLGRLKPYKNVDIAIKAFAQVVKIFPKAKFFIAGNGQSKCELEKLVGSLGMKKHIIFLGSITEEKKIQLLSESWLTVQPSMIEGWGITVIESNASGTPVIASDVNGLRDSIVHNKTGILVKPKDITGFKNAIMQCFTDKKFLRMLSKEAYIWSNNFSWDISADIFMKKITNVLAEEKGIVIK